MRFRRGDVDLTWAEPFAADPAWRPYVRRAPKPTIWAVAMNLRFSPWNDVHVRRAVAFAIDRDALARASRGVHAALGCFLPAGISGHDDANAQVFDLDRARRELALAGYAAGLPEEQELWTFPELSDKASLIQADLARVGIRVRLRVVEPATMQAEAPRSPGIPLQINGWTPDFADTSDYFDPVFHTGGSSNLSGYSDPVLDALLDQARAEGDPARRAAMYTEAERMVSADAPWAFAVQELDLADLQPWLKGYSTAQFMEFDLREVWLDLPRRPWRDP
jgi:peptide/nickel transport system substrate-binding protein